MEAPITIHAYHRSSYQPFGTILPTKRRFQIKSIIVTDREIDMSEKYYKT